MTSAAKGRAKGGKRVEADSHGLSLEGSESGSSYYLSGGGDSVMFTPEEMLALVRIAHGRETAIEAARAIGDWLQRERRDALDGLVPAGASRPALVELVGLLRSRFRKPGAS